jgi:hypothetical protein
MKAWLIGGAVALIVLIAGGVFWLRSNLDSVVTHAISHYGSQMTQARVGVDAVEIRSSDGVGVVRGLLVANPGGFRTAHALQVGRIEVAIDLHTLTDAVIVIKRIVIESPDVVYEKGESQTNFDAIERNIARSTGGNGGKKEASSGSSGRKLIVEELLIRNATAHASAPLLGGKTVTAPLPDITLHDVGRAQGGITPGQLGAIVARALSQRLAQKLVFDRAIKSLGDRVKGLFGNK